MAPLPALHNTLQPQPQIGVRQNAASPTTVPFPLSTTDPTSASPTAQIVVPHSDSSNSGLVAGATIGAIFGFLVLVVIFYKCCIDNRSAIWVPPFHTSYDDSDSEFGSSRGSRSSRVRRRGGDGGWSSRDGVRKPRKARVRRQRNRSESSAGSRGTSRRRRERRVSGAAVANNNGLMGWYWASSGRPKGRSRDYDRHGDVWAGGRGKSIDD